MTTTSCISWRLMTPPKSAGSTSILPTSAPSRLKTGTLIGFWSTCVDTANPFPRNRPGKNPRCGVGLPRGPVPADGPYKSHDRVENRPPDRECSLEAITEGLAAQDADLDFHTGGQAESLVERFDGLAGRLEDVDE